MWIGRWKEGQNPIFLHHCEGAPDPVCGEIFAVYTGGFLYKPVLSKKKNYLHITIILTILLFPAPGFLMALTSCLVKC